jgi:hypothetical protein
MLEILAGVRKHTTNTAVIVGSAACVYDSAALVQLDAKLKAQGETNVMTVQLSSLTWVHPKRET